MPVEKHIDLGKGMKITFMLIPPGEFMMGSTDADRSRFLEAAATDNDTSDAHTTLTPEILKQKTGA